MDGPVQGPGEGPLGHACPRLGLRRGDGLRDAERIPQRRVHSLRLPLDRLRQDLAVTGGRSPGRASQRRPRRPEGQTPALSRHRHGCLRLAQPRRDMDGDDGRPSARGRAGSRRRTALGRPRRRNARPESLRRGGGALAQVEGGCPVGRAPRLSRQADQGEPSPRIWGEPVDSLWRSKTRTACSGRSWTGPRVAG